jgi:D-alanine-D-alanine ligase
MKVTVLAGGTSTEREVSLASAGCVMKALKNAGHQVRVIDPGADWSEIDPAAAPGTVPRKFCSLPEGEALCNLRESGVVLSVLHGGQGEDGTLHAVLELLGLPYVGSRPGASAAAMDKVVSKRLFASAGVPTPDYLVLERGDSESWPAAVEAGAALFGFPMIVKPADQGSTIGLAKAGSVREVLEAAGAAARWSRQVLVEKFIRGRELTVGVLAGVALPVLEIVVPGGLYDFKAKYQSHDNRYICPAEIEAPAAARAQHLALEAFRVLGLDDYARIDFLLEPDGALWCLEANNQPGMTDSSLLPKEAKVLGLDLAALLERLLQSALDRRAARPA